MMPNLRTPGCHTFIGKGHLSLDMDVIVILIGLEMLRTILF